MGGERRGRGGGARRGGGGGGVGAAVVTGCSSGIGAALCGELARRGVRVFALGRDPGALRGLEAEGGAGGVVALRADVTDAQSLETAFAEAARQAPGGRIDLCVANAGVSGCGALAVQVRPPLPAPPPSFAPPAPPDRPPFAPPAGPRPPRRTAPPPPGRAASSDSGPLQEHRTVQSIFDTNVTGACATVQVAARHMLEQERQGPGGLRGVIAVTGSVTSEVCMPWAAAYCASKAAIKSLCRTSALELEPFGVRVTHLYTGAVKSKIADNALARDPLASYDAPDNPYHPYAAAIRGRARVSQGRAAWTAERYASEVATALLSPRPPREVVAGGGARALRLFARTLPERLQDWVACRRFGL